MNQCEIKDIKEFSEQNQNKYEIEFKNGEKIVLEGKGELKVTVNV